MSRLSDYEFIKIVATIESSFVDKYNCDECCSEFLNYKEDKREERLLGKKKSKGCFDFKTMKSYIKLDDKGSFLSFLGCPGNYTSLSVNYYMDLFYQFDVGVLPFKGNIGEQPAKVVEIIKLISSRINKCSKEKLEREKKNDR